MADAITMTLDTTALEQAITAMPAVLQTHVLTACRETAERVVREAKARLQRQLGPFATGETVANISVIPAYDGNGYVVLSDNPRMPNLPLWLEKGTRAGKRRNMATIRARPFFYASLALEAGGHERRILDAMQESAEAVGLGG